MRDMFFVGLLVFGLGNPSALAAQPDSVPEPQLDPTATQVLGATLGSSVGFVSGLVVGFPLAYRTDDIAPLLIIPVSATLLAAGGAALGSGGQTSYGRSVAAATVGAAAGLLTLALVGPDVHSFGAVVAAWAIPQGLLTGLLANARFSLPRAMHSSERQ